MPAAHLHTPHRPAEDAPDASEPGSLPVEPDKGPIPAVIPDDPEHERLAGPEDLPLQGGYRSAAECVGPMAAGR